MSTSPYLAVMTHPFNVIASVLVFLDYESKAEMKSSYKNKLKTLLCMNLRKLPRVQSLSVAVQLRIFL